MKVFNIVPLPWDQSLLATLLVRARERPTKCTFFCVVCGFFFFLCGSSGPLSMGFSCFIGTFPYAELTYAELTISIYRMRKKGNNQIWNSHQLGQSIKKAITTSCLTGPTPLLSLPQERVHDLNSDF